MIAFELAAAIAGIAAAPQYIEPERYSATARPASRAVPRTTSTRAPANTTQHLTHSQKPIANCGTTHKGYDARTGTYRDARGKRQNCPR